MECGDTIHARKKLLYHKTLLINSIKILEIVKAAVTQFVMAAFI